MRDGKGLSLALLYFLTFKIIVESFNQVFLRGVVASSPEVSSQKNNEKTTVNFPLAISYKQSHEDGTKTEEIDFHCINATQELGEFCLKSLAKGNNVFIIGKIQNRIYEEEIGNKKFITEIIANEVNILSNSK